MNKETTAVTVADAETRIHLATAVSATKREAEDRKQRVQKDKAKQVEMAAQSQRIKDEIEQCNLELKALPMLHRHKGTPCHPTPVGRTVTGDELHFRLAAGRIAYIPLTELFDRARHALSVKVAALASMEARIETVHSGLALIMLSRQINRRRSVYVRSREWAVKPARYDIGETLDEALRVNLDFAPFWLVLRRLRL